MKKIIVVFLMVALCAVSVFAIDFSTGSNLDYSYQWTQAKISHANLFKGSASESANLLGINAFIDAQYVRAGMGVNFSVGGVKCKLKVTANNPLAQSLIDGVVEDLTKTMNEEGKKMSMLNFNISVLGKYPFKIGIANIYPMAGFDFAFNISAKYDGEDIKKDLHDDYKKDLNHFYFVAGLGSDIFVTNNVFITPTMLFGVDMRKSNAYKDAKKAFPNLKITSNNFLFNMSVGVGYKF